MSKTILCCLSEWGYWGEELVGPYDVLTEHGYQVDFMTPTGQKPPALPPSMQAGFLDPPLDKVVIDEHFAQRTREIQESNLLDKPINLAQWFRRCPTSTARDSATVWRTTTTGATPAGRSWTNTMRCCYPAAAARWSTWSTTNAYMT